MSQMWAEITRTTLVIRRFPSQGVLRTRQMKLSTSDSKIVLQKLKVPQPVKKLPVLYGIQALLQRSQQHATCH